MFKTKQELEDLLYKIMEDNNGDVVIALYDSDYENTKDFNYKEVLNTTLEELKDLDEDQKKVLKLEIIKVDITNEDQLNIIEDVVGLRVVPLFLRIKESRVLKLSPGFIVSEEQVNKLSDE